MRKVPGVAATITADEHVEPKQRTRETRVLVTSFDFRPGVGGIATVAYELFRALNARDDMQVRVLAPTREGADAFDAASEIEVVRARLGRSYLWSVLPFARAIRKQIRLWQPDVVVNLVWLPDGVATRVATVGIRMPYYVFAHGVEVLESRRTLRKRLRGWLSPWKRAVFRDAERAFAVSHYTCSELTAFGIPAERIDVLGNGVDAATFSPRTKARDLVDHYGLDGKRVLMTLCRLHDYKGVDVGIEAFARIADEQPDVQYLVCGAGPDRPRLERLVAHHRLDGRVIFTGFVPPERLCDYYNLCDIFVLLSREDRLTPNVEGFGLVLLEAAACGKPSIAGNSGGIPDAVGDTAWLVSPTDVDEIAAAMTHALGDADDRQTLAAAARERATHLSWCAIADRVACALLEQNPRAERSVSGVGAAAQSPQPTPDPPRPPVDTERPPELAFPAKVNAVQGLERLKPRARALINKHVVR